MPDKILFFITVDHLAPTDLACNGNRETQTPSLDKLVLDGVVFDEHYASATFLNASLNAWTTGLPIAEHGTASINKLGEALAANRIELTQISDAGDDFTEQIQQFFDSIEKKRDYFCWLRVSTAGKSTASERAAQLENVIARLHKKVDQWEKYQIAWLITSEQGALPEEETPETISAFYATQWQQSLSRKLGRPLILSGNFLPEDCPQRIQSLTVAQDIHWTILEYLGCEIPSSFTSQSLIACFSQPQQQDRQLLLLDNNLAGLRTSTDLTVVTVNPEEESDTASAQYYLKPEDRSDVNDLSTTAPEHVEKRIAELKELLNKFDKSKPG